MKNFLIPILAVVFFVLDSSTGQTQEAKPLVLDVVGKISKETERNCAACHQDVKGVDEFVGDICPAMVQQSANQMANLEALIAKAQSSKAVANAAQSRAATWLRATQAQLSTAERERVAEVAEQDLAKAEVVERRAQALAAVNLAEGQHAQALAAYHAALAKKSQLNDYVVQLLDARGNEALQEFALKALIAYGDNATGSQDAASLYWIGVQCEPAGEITVRIEQHGGNMLTVKGGLRVNAVTAESPAQAAGVQELDVILFMNDKPINQIEDLAAVVNENAEKAATLSVVRDNNAISLSVTPALRPQSNVAEVNLELALDLQGAERQRLLLDQFYDESRAATPKPKLPDGFEATLRFTPETQLEFTIKQAEQSWVVNAESLAQVPADAQPFAAFVLQAFSQPSDESNSSTARNLRAWMGIDQAALSSYPNYHAHALNYLPRSATTYTTPEPYSREVNDKLDQVQKQLNELRDLIETMKK